MNLKFIILRLDSKEVVAYRSKIYVSQKQKEETVYIQIYLYLGIRRRGVTERLESEIMRKTILKSFTGHKISNRR